MKFNFFILKSNLLSNFKKILFKIKNPYVYIGDCVQIIGLDKLRLGQNITFSDNTWININNRNNPDVYMTINDNSYVGRNNFFTVGKTIELHEYFFSSINCKFICSSHEKDPFNPYLSNETEFRDSILIETNCFIGADASIIGNVRIGYGSIIGANSVVTTDIPPLSIVVGNPARIIKRYDLDEKKWKIVSCTEKLRFPSEEEYRRMITNNEIDINKVYFATTYKGWI